MGYQNLKPALEILSQLLHRYLIEELHPSVLPFQVSEKSDKPLMYRQQIFTLNNMIETDDDVIFVTYVIQIH